MMHRLRETGESIGRFTEKEPQVGSNFLPDLVKARFENGLAPLM